jgi:hypothetical protein
MGRKLSRLWVIGLSLAYSGCSGESAAPILGLPKPAEQSEVDEKPSVLTALLTPLTPQKPVVGTPTEVYTRVARGVLTCWFGASGPLKSGFIYHADAEPASKGGNSEIKILTRDPAAEDPRSIRAYLVAISPSDGKTKVEIENVRIPEPLASRLTADVERWSTDESGCGERPVTAGWAAEQVQDTKAAKKGKAKAKSP